MRKIRTLWKARALLRNPRALMRVFRDERTPMIARAVPIAALLYVVFPIDVLPDIIPFVGQLDDIAIVLTALSYAISHIPNEVLKSHGLSASDLS